MKWSNTARKALVATVSVLAACPAALADSGRSMPRDTPAAYWQECTSCHVAYPPGMLPARSWDRIMRGLATHYGSDASLDAALEQQIGGWLRSHAGTYKRVREEPPQDRITLTAWFERKHRKLDPAVWTDAAVKTAAHCVACHPAAERGRYDDDDLRFPPGLDARYRRTGND